MARLLKQSTAFTFRAGPFVDSTDGVTAETGLSIGQADIQISKDGGAFAQTSDASPTTTHDADGWYQCPLTATDTDTLGSLTVQIAMSGALPVFEHFMVVPAWLYDIEVDGLGTESGTAQAGATGSITLASGASATDDFHNGDTVWVYDGTGAGQAPRTITDYVGSTKVASVSPNWTTTPSTDSKYIIFPSAPATTAAGSLPGVDVLAISGDTTAADNLEAAHDGTGYDIGGIDVSVLNTAATAVGSNGTGLTEAGLTSGEVGDAVLDEVVEGSYTLRELIRIFAAALAGKASGLGTTSAAFRDLADSKDRIAATVDADGNRTAVTLDGS